MRTSAIVHALSFPVLLSTVTLAPRLSPSWGAAGGPVPADAAGASADEGAAASGRRALPSTAMRRGASQKLDEGWAPSRAAPATAAGEPHAAWGSPEPAATPVAAGASAPGPAAASGRRPVESPSTGSSSPRAPSALGLHVASKLDRSDASWRAGCSAVTSAAGAGEAATLSVPPPAGVAASRGLVPAHVLLSVSDCSAEPISSSSSWGAPPAALDQHGSCSGSRKLFGASGAVLAGRSGNSGAVWVTGPAERASLAASDWFDGSVAFSVVSWRATASRSRRRFCRQLLASAQDGTEGTRKGASGALGRGPSGTGPAPTEISAGAGRCAVEEGALQGRAPPCRPRRWPCRSDGGAQCACCTLRERLPRVADRSRLAFVADLSRVRCSVGSLHAEGSQGRAASEALPTAPALSAFTSDEGDGALLGAHGRTRRGRTWDAESGRSSLQLAAPARPWEGVCPEQERGRCGRAVRSKGHCTPSPWRVADPPPQAGARSSRLHEDGATCPSQRSKPSSGRRSIMDPPKPVPRLLRLCWRLSLAHSARRHLTALFPA